MRRELRHRRDLIKAVIDRKGLDFDAYVSQDELPEAPQARRVGIITATIETVRVHALPALPEVLYRRAS